MDKRKTGEGAMKGWATRRQRAADRDDALVPLVEVAESITGEVVLKTPVPGYPDMIAIHANTVINWRDRINCAIRRVSEIRMQSGRSIIAK